MVSINCILVLPVHVCGAPGLWNREGRCAAGAADLGRHHHRHCPFCQPVPHPSSLIRTGVPYITTGDPHLQTTYYYHTPMNKEMCRPRDMRKLHTNYVPVYTNCRCTCMCSSRSSPTPLRMHWFPSDAMIEATRKIRRVLIRMHAVSLLSPSAVHARVQCTMYTLYTCSTTIECTAIRTLTTGHSAQYTACRA